MNQFVILTTQRSGSTFLVRALDSHSEIRCYGELFINHSGNINKEDDYRYFHYMREKWYRRFLVPLASRSHIKRFLDEKLKANSGLKTVGFKLMYNQCNGALFDWIKANDVSVVHLIRENILESLVSTEIRRRTNVAHSNSVVEVSPFEIDVNMISRQLSKRHKQIQKYRNKLGDYRNLIEVSYDDYFSNRKKNDFEILSFLGVDPACAIDSDLKKINMHKLHDILINYDELVMSLKDTPFARLV